MFGILLTASAVVGKCINSVKNITYDYKSKTNAIHDNKERYYDHNGASRLVENDLQVYDTTLKNGDRVTKDINGNIVSNYDYPIREQWIKELNKKLINEDSPVRCVGFFYDLYPENQRKKIWKYIPNKQRIFESIETHKRYIRKMATSNLLPKYYYINLENGDIEFLDEYNDYAYEWLMKKNNNKTDYIIVDRY